MSIEPLTMFDANDLENHEVIDFQIATIAVKKETMAGTACRHGTFVHPGDFYIGKALELFGEYSETEVRFLCSLLKPGDVVVEAGAHIGTICVPMSKVVGETGAVHAFEPQEDIRDFLRANVQNNGLSSFVSVYALALGEGSYKTTYSPNERNTGGVELELGRVRVRSPLKQGDHVAEVVTLDSYELPRLDLLKADVEGMEVEVLAGAQQTIARCRPMIYVENDRPWQARQLMDTLFSLGYRLWRHEPPLFSSDNFNNTQSNPWPYVVSFNLIAAPGENPAPPQVQGLIEILPGQWAAVCRFGGVGDNLIAAAVLSDLVRQGNRVEVITNHHAGVVFENNPYVDKLSICKDGDQPADGGKEWQGWFEKRGHEYKGGLYHLSHSVECSLAFVQAQTQFWWRPEVRRMIAGASYVELASGICGTAHEYYPLFYPTAVERAKAMQTKAKVGPKAVGWVICGSRFDKVHPYTAHAIARIIKELRVPVIMFGAPKTKDYEIAKSVQRDVEKHNGSLDGLHLAMTAESPSKDGAEYNAEEVGNRWDSSEKDAGQWPIRRSLTQVMTCDVVITPDTGLAWACAFEAMPKIVLLSHASPKNITAHSVNTTTLHADQQRVPCWPCHRLHDVLDTCVMNKDKTGVACMSDISVETILQATARALS